MFPLVFPEQKRNIFTGILEKICPGWIQNASEDMVCFECDPKEEPELSRFHKYDAKGNVKGVRDMEIVDYLIEHVRFFVLGTIPYY